MSKPQEPAPFTLTSAEKSSLFWARLKEHMIAELDISRKRNDSAKLTDAETAALRGKISALKALIALGEDGPQTRT